MSQNSVAGLLTQLTNSATLLMVVDSKQTGVDESAITPVLTAFETTGLNFNDNDFATVISALTANIDEGQTAAQAGDETVHHIAMIEFFSFALLVKIGVLSDDLSTTESHFEVKQILEDLTTVQSIEKPPASAPSAPPLTRRRTTRRTRTPVSSQQKSQLSALHNKLDPLAQLAQDSHAFDERFILGAIELVSKQLNGLDDENTSPTLVQIIIRLVTCHHQYKQLLATHVNRCGLLLNTLSTAEHYTLSTAVHEQEATQRLKQWLTEQAAATDIDDVQQLSLSYLSSRGRIDALLGKMKWAVDGTTFANSLANSLANNLASYLPKQATTTFEARQAVGELLSHMLSNIADLATAHWQTLSNNHESQDLTDNQTFNCHALQVFNHTQSYKTQLLSLVVNIDKIGDKLHQEIDKSAKDPALSELIHGLGKEIALMLTNNAPCSAGIEITRPKVTFEDGSVVINADTITLSTALHTLIVDFERLATTSDDSIPQQTLDELRRHSDITLNCVIKAMDETGNNYLQLITALRAQNQPKTPIQAQPEIEVSPLQNYPLQNNAPNLADVTHEVVDLLCQNGPMLMQRLENGGALNALLQIVARLDPAAKLASLSETLLPLNPVTTQQCL
ncbi:MAG: hypothetical protein HRT35_29000, partial [Algicola sp.]|nr:hypothetical protein [Algicola sp.]